MATPMTRPQAIAELTAPGMPYALADATIRGQRQRVFVNAPPSLRPMYEATATDLPFLVYEDERWTFAQAWADASRIGHVLVHDCGVRPGDRVAIAMRNYPEWVLGFTAITSIGAVAVAMNGHWQADELAYGLQDSGANVVLADAERLQRLSQPGVRAALPDLQCLAVRCTDLPAGARSLRALVDAVGEVPMPPADIQPEDYATILYTSGSTGHPKGVVSTHRNVLSALLSWELDAAIGERVAGLEPAPAQNPGTLLAVPLFHVSGLHTSYLAGYRAQRRMVAMYRWDAELAAQLIERERLTSCAAPAAMTGDLIRVAKEKRHDLSCLLLVGGGGAPRAPEQVRQIAQSFGQAQPATGWGMTETNAIGVGIGGEDYLARPASSGRCSQVLELKIIDERGEALPTGQRGELLVRGTSVFPGYWNRPEANAQSFLPGGWFRTGDIACLDEEGFLFIVDRLKDLIIRGGENIGCGQVEAALLMHPHVHEASVYAVPDERLGEEVGATVHGSPQLDVEALRGFLAGHLARFEIPRYIQVSAQPLPRTPSGKILKREIRQAALAAIAPGQAQAQAAAQAPKPGL
ncbi:class I adenylate-forming enzyme family protein [Xenophilus sp. Marseille-Q4582]|uniref:class I adenylate-forming enzyme family protein n=1 Tax=Xenophilus sp. Marseille-Q4582 TaxID=2866600 RepID=UPI001CE494AE|nr:class I adenylate-forming enzyme family protein [Xenophilus sp. Marseille-Q4582]